MSDTSDNFSDSLQQTLKKNLSSTCNTITIFNARKYTIFDPVCAKYVCREFSQLFFDIFFCLLLT